ncbi:MAG TPA: diaminopropionate ammonia-lyase [candidate division Zixibacteria bacterium]|nr:diaminopropionate ammonia-lyase [candidate division Zixibacteria bacterium]
MDADEQTSRFILNQHRQTEPVWPAALTGPFQVGAVRAVHKAMAGYSPTPLISLPHLAARLGVGEILVKDESFRFSLKAFKILGASYAIDCFLRRELDRPGLRPGDIYRNRRLVPAGLHTFCTATDGNHGRAVAHIARIMRQYSAIFVPSDTVPARIDNIRREGARVTVVDGCYDDAVKAAISSAQQNGWQIISDTSWPGYEEIPRDVSAGYITLFDEIKGVTAGQTSFDLIFIPGGVGTLAACGAWYYRHGPGKSTAKLICVEPTESACLLESAADPQGRPTPSKGNLKTIMAGLNCANISPVVWPLIRDAFDGFLAIDDSWAVQAMRAYYFPSDDDRQIVAGESGAATLAALLALINDPKLESARAAIGLNPKSRILLLNTEGDTDPDHFTRVVLS